MPSLDSWSHPLRLRRVLILLAVLIVGALGFFHSRERPASPPQLDRGQQVLRVVALDAETGLPVPGVRWGLGTERWPPSGKQPPEAHARARLREQMGIALPAGRESPYGETRWGVATVIVQPPSGYVAWDDTGLDLSNTAPFAATLEYRYPLRREVAVALGTDAGAVRAPGDLVICALVTAGKVHCYAETDVRARDGGRVSGVPYYRGQKVSLLAAPHASWSSVAEGVTQAVAQAGLGTFRIPGAFWIEGNVSESPECGLRLRLAPSGILGPWPFVGSPHEIETGVTLHFWGSDGPLEDYIEPDQIEPRLRPGCQVRIRALRATGAPAVGAWVSLNRERCVASGEGIAIFEDVPPGPTELRLWGSGVLGTSDAVVVPAEETCLLTLTEREGGTLKVQVVDAGGRGLPFAHLTVDTHSVDLTGPARNTQRLDWFTDKHGRRTFQQVDPGPTEVRVHWGGRWGEAEVTVRQSVEMTARVVLR